MITANNYYRQKFGCRIYRLSLDGGFTCPNRDGRAGVGGCAFCSAEGSGEFSADRNKSIGEQLEEARRRVEKKNKNGKYMAYFQAFTGTYAPVERLEELYRTAMNADDIVGLTVATRPDCLERPVTDLLKKLNAVKPVTVELGLQTASDATAASFNRGYPTGVYDDAVHRLNASGIEVITHVMLGLPGETEEMMLDTVRHACAAGTSGIKFHLLYILRGTKYEQEWREGRIRCMTMEEYGAVLKKCIAVLPDETVVYRLTGDGAKRDLLAPLWTADKKRVFNYLHAVLDM